MPTIESLHADLQETKERQAMTEKALYGSPERAGMLTLIDRFGRCVERVEKRLDDWESEKKSQRNGIVLLALSGLVTGMIGAIGWGATWVMAKMAGKLP